MTRMDGLMSPLDEIITTIKKPLLYASKNNFINLGKVKDLKLCVHTQSQKALKLPLDEPLKKTFQHLFDQFSTFDSLPVEQKRQTIEDALSSLHHLGETGAVFPEKMPEKKPLDTSIQYIKGVGPRISEMLGKKGIQTIGDALYFLPRKYEDRRSIKKVADCIPNRTEIVRGKISMINVVPYRRGRKRVFEIGVSDDTGMIVAKWFHFNDRYMRQKYKKDQQVILTGEIKRYNVQKEVHHPEMEIIDLDEEKSWEFKKIVPIYSETEGLYQKTMRRIMKKVVDEHAFSLVEGIPEPIRGRLQLIPLAEAVRRVPSHVVPYLYGHALQEIAVVTY